MDNEMMPWFEQRAIPNEPSLYDQEFRDVFNAIDVMFLEANGIEPWVEALWTRD